MFSRYRAMRRADFERSRQEGFTLIELLIVIIIMGILAAVVIFALGGVTGSSAIAACNTDVKTVEVGVAAYAAQNNGAVPADTTAAVTTPLTLANSAIGQLTSGTNPALRSWPNNDSHYYVGLGETATYTGATGVIQYETSKGVITNVTPAGVTITNGTVYVSLAHTDGAVGGTAAPWTNYDTSVASGSDICNTAT
jgi:general secretion pathway protein G